MIQNLKTQLEASEKLRLQQQKIIDNQKNQILHLESINSNLESEVLELKSYVENLSSDYEEVVSICKEQQAILNSLTKH